MVGPNRHNDGAQLLLLVAAFNSLSFPSLAGSLYEVGNNTSKYWTLFILMNIANDKDRLFLFMSDLSQLSRTLLSVLNEWRKSNKSCLFSLSRLTCEEKFKDAGIKFTFGEYSLNGNIRKLINSYYDWGELLAVAPRAVSGLERLIGWSHHPKMDFPIDDKVTPIGGFTHINAHQVPGEFPNDFTSNWSSRLFGLTESSHEYRQDPDVQFERIQSYQGCRSVIDVITETLVFGSTRYQNQQKRWSWKELDSNGVGSSVVKKPRMQSTPQKEETLEVIQALQEGVEDELTNLKTDWMELKDFYSKMNVFAAKATENSIVFIEVVIRVIARDLNVLGDDEIFGNLLEKIQRANEASFLVRGVSDMYVNVSIKYIMDQIASQGDIMASIDNS
ncbi:hypothetical protein DAPPUDRAFT_118125 [Daphnia pulex]|uniref:Uncharacterized protein n=1 Tax=Daphnia pulex TaxID=6669 RepID=E9HUT9_DAPPU|nr:hypothetical protein DAPPUDRAFT_118125 [Daphnia pulex]|eukprot:EFX64483.1 hypothetical protein DAPPUDRAFT_118125 [Daphnia pulex]